MRFIEGQLKKGSPCKNDIGPLKLYSPIPEILGTRRYFTEFSFLQIVLSTDEHLRELMIINGFRIFLGQILYCHKVSYTCCCTLHTKWSPPLLCGTTASSMPFVVNVPLLCAAAPNHIIIELGPNALKPFLFYFETAPPKPTGAHLGDGVFGISCQPLSEPLNIRRRGTTITPPPWDAVPAHR
ncbi:hypothetical protein B0F90DRAFT_1717910 [Multifurca ochricompacta]|uniref:Uncharacterized protein n=1 Tax=Multifurca ochricompacta TaxID=376703 RepID=A0AAD4M445_9AGAM|nr:hypothetical protein B0F90DRAFT_1717910 [Multifurca ochricompacta]